MLKNIFGTQKLADNRGFSTAGTIFGVVVVVAVGVAAYIQWGGSGAGSAPTVDEVISAHQSVDSFQYETGLTLETQLNPSELEARSDSQQLQQALQYIPNTPSQGFPESFAAELSVNGSVALASSTVGQARTDVTVSAGVDQLEDVLALNLRRTDGMQYLRAQTLPDIGFFSLSQYEGNWYSASSTSQPQFNPADFSNQLPSGVSADTEVSPQTARELAQAMVSEGVIAIDNRVRTELRSGAPAWQLQLSVNPDQADNYRQAARDIISKNNPELTEDSALFATSSDASDFQASLKQFNNRVDKFDLWIDRNSDRIRRVVIEAQLDESELAELSQDESRLGGVTEATITFDVGLSAYNEPISVEAPENAQPLQSIFGGMQMMQGGSAQPTGNTPTAPVQY